MIDARNTDSVVKTVFFHTTTVFVIGVIVLTEVSLPANTSAFLRFALCVAGLAFLVAGTSMYLYSELHESLSCLALNVAAFVLVFAMVFIEVRSDAWVVMVARVVIVLLPPLLARAFFDIAPAVRWSRAVMWVFDVVAVLGVAFLVVVLVAHLDERTARVVSSGLFVIGGSAATVLLLVLALTVSRGATRAALLTIAAVALVQAALLVVLPEPKPTEPLAWAWVLASTLLPVAVVATSLRTKFVDPRLRRDLSYAIATAAVAGCYAIGLVLLSKIPHLGGLVAAVSIGALSIAFVPVIRAVHRAIDRWFYRDAYDYRTVLTHLASATPGSRDVYEVAHTLCVEVQAALNLRWCAVYAAAGVERELLYATDPLGAELAIVSGERDSAGVIHFPLGVPGRSPGQLVICQRSARARLRQVDEDLLRTVAYQAGIALENSHLIASLDERILKLEDAQATARILGRRLSESEERTRARLSRDIHDGALQSLFRLVRVAEGVSPSTKGIRLDDGAQLDEIADLGRDIAFELRQVCEDLRPPMLDQLTLADALEALATRFRSMKEWRQDITKNHSGEQGGSGQAGPSREVKERPWSQVNEIRHRHLQIQLSWGRHTASLAADALNFAVMMPV